jgi:hypothetical protein
MCLRPTRAIYALFMRPSRVFHASLFCASFPRLCSAFFVTSLRLLRDSPSFFRPERVFPAFFTRPFSRLLWVILALPLATLPRFPCVPIVVFCAFRTSIPLIFFPLGRGFCVPHRP